MDHQGCHMTDADAEVANALFSKNLGEREEEIPSFSEAGI